MFFPISCFVDNLMAYLVSDSKYKYYLCRRSHTDFVFCCCRSPMYISVSLLVSQYQKSFYFLV